MCSHPPEFTEENIHSLFATAKRLAARWVDAGDTEDVAQEAVVRLLRQPEPPDNVVGWLYVVTRRISNRQRLRTLMRRSVESSYRVGGAARSDPDVLLDARTILERLPPRDRRLLLLVVEGIASAEIAKEFGCNVRDIGQMVARARRKARRLLLNTHSVKNL